jgi:hypothetical protein
MRRDTEVRFLVTLLILPVLLLVGCTAAQQDLTRPAPSITPSKLATAQPGPGVQPFDVLASPSPYCRPNEAFVELSVPTTHLTVGQLLTVTVTLANGDDSDVQLGQIQYSLDVQPDTLALSNPEMIEHPISIIPGGSDQAHIILHTTAPGKLVLTASASYEMHAMDYSWASWSGCHSHALEIAIAPE